MSNVVPYQDVEKMAQAVAKSGLFGVKTPEQAIGLMLIAQAEGIHPAAACQMFDIIQGRPAMKSVTMLGRFQQQGGVVNWLKREDGEVSAEFSHGMSCPKPLTVTWTMDRAKKAGLTSKENWIKYPRQMLTARVIGEGVRATYPASCFGFYAVEEVQDEPIINGNGNGNHKPINTVEGLKESLKAKVEEAVISEPKPIAVAEKVSEPVKEVRKSDPVVPENIDTPEDIEWDEMSNVSDMVSEENPKRLINIPVGDTLPEGEFILLEVEFKENIGRSGKSTLRVQDAEGQTYYIGKWGKVKEEIPSETLVTILLIKVGEYNGKRQYMCDKVLVK